MDDHALHLRIRRLYAAIGAAQETDMSRLPARVVSTPRFLDIIQDFSGGASSAELENMAISVILNVASLRDHIRRWASRTDRDKGKVDETFEKSLALKIVQDLFDRDKHAGPGRNGGYSGCSPMLSNIGRVMRLQTQARAGSRVAMVFGTDGTPRIAGDGFAAAVLEAGFWAGMTLYPVSKCTPERAVDMVEIYGPERLMVNSAGDWGPSKPTAVPDFILAMRKRGHPESLIRRVVYENPLEFFRQSRNFPFTPPDAVGVA